MAISEEGLHLERLPPEHWGSRLRQARKARRLGVKDVERITEGRITSSALSALELLPECPLTPSKRLRAASAMVVYRFHPEDIDLSMDDLRFADVPLLYSLLGGPPDGGAPGTAEWAAWDSNPEPAGENPHLHDVLDGQVAA